MVVTKSNTSVLPTLDHPIPFEVYGEGEHTLVFLHANGYPPGAYQSLFDELSRKYRIIAMHLRPLWPNAQAKEVNHWAVFSHDLHQFIHQQGLQNVSAVGHSMGGTILLRAALWQPHIFSSLILIDPVLLPPQYILLWKLISLIPLNKKMHPLVRSAMKRRQYFSSEAEMYENYRKKEVFAKISDEGLRNYVRSMAVPLDNGHISLRYPPEWEARIYLTGIKNDLDIWRNLPRLSRPLMVLRGVESNTFWHQTARMMQKRHPKIRIHEIPGATHLLPLEKPQEVAAIILECLATSL